MWSLWKQDVQLDFVNAPPCSWSPSPPLELKGAAVEVLFANAGFVSFGIVNNSIWFHKMNFPAIKSAAALFGVAGVLARKTTVCFTVKCSEGFMHTRMRRRVESLIQALDRAKPDKEKAKKTGQSRSFKRLSLKEDRSGLKS
ncbi:hypothetical protein RHGRI_026595 [Rhododendron griersonianum]|uniref:Arp2/3 complex 34 kDa subunit n=1 Tax=Rhododendron griersonianum TaxID=479676 RepID=A0AAV6IUW3_9ERIC|nr:hypothetical protein RHGRI_026595 [Rhododendron griersonianum]